MKNSFAGSAAGTNTLNYPYGLAVDGKRDLYAANSNDNDILVYNASHVLVPSRTITQNVSAPSGIAFDSLGNLWVANQNSNSITGYGPTGVETTKGTITSGVDNPQAIAFDGVGNIRVNNSFSDLTFYLPFATSRFTRLTREHRSLVLPLTRYTSRWPPMPPLSGSRSAPFWSPTEAVPFNSQRPATPWRTTRLEICIAATTITPRV